MFKNKNLMQKTEKGNTKYADKTVQDLDEMWEIISRSILEAARKTLPKKKILNTTANKRNNKSKKSELTKTLVQLGRWITLERKNIKLDLILENIEDFNNTAK